MSALSQPQLRDFQPLLEIKPASISSCCDCLLFRMCCVRCCCVQLLHPDGVDLLLRAHTHACCCFLLCTPKRAFSWPWGGKGGRVGVHLELLGSYLNPLVMISCVAHYVNRLCDSPGQAEPPEIYLDTVPRVFAAAHWRFPTCFDLPVCELFR